MRPECVRLYGLRSIATALGREHQTTDTELSHGRVEII